MGLNYSSTRRVRSGLKGTGRGWVQVSVLDSCRTLFQTTFWPHCNTVAEKILCVTDWSWHGVGWQLTGPLIRVCSHNRRRQPSDHKSEKPPRQYRLGTLWFHVIIIIIIYCIFIAPFKGPKDDLHIRRQTKNRPKQNRTTENSGKCLPVKLN